MRSEIEHMKELFGFLPITEYQLDIIKDIIKIVEWHPATHYLVLDLGCGSGRLLNLLANEIPNILAVGLDLYTPPINMRKTKVLNFVVADTLHPPFRENIFDLVIMVNFLHHLVGKTGSKSKRNIEDLLCFTQRLIKGGGILFLDEMAISHKAGRSLLFWLSRLIATLRIYVVFLGIHGQVVFFMTSNELKESILDTGLKIIKIKSLPSKQKFLFRMFFPNGYHFQVRTVAKKF